MKEIFISYRRDDTESEARALKLSLEKLSQQGIFMDRSDLQMGHTWPEEIQNALDNAKVVLVIIGDKWLACRDVHERRRIDDEKDLVRHEIKSALEKKKLVIPVLVRNARMVTEEDLPADIKELANRQAMWLHQATWENDIYLLWKGFKDRDLKVPSILVTSKSPRRKELLRQIGWIEGEHYYTANAGVNLKVDSDEQKLSLSKVKEIVERNACEKVDFVKNFVMSDQDILLTHVGKILNPSETLIVGVDTVVFCNGKILDRPLLRALEFAGPEDIENARQRAKQMLMEQSGQPISVFTSIAVALASDSKNKKIKTVETKAELRNYTEADIDDYIACAEPFDKAGALAIQEKGVSLFKSIQGSYTNIVGLPLQEFISLLQESYGNIFSFPELKSSLYPNGEIHEMPALSALAVGDINYDYVYDELPEDFFSTLHQPGKKVNKEIYRGAGGTAVNFARGAKRAGFDTCYVVGVVGGDALGQEIIKELHRDKIIPLLPADPTQLTSIAIILRNKAREDTSITLTDARQSLPPFSINQAREMIQTSDLFYCSGYCLIDPNRRSNAIKMLQIGNEANRLIVLDVVVGMDMKSLSVNLTNEKTRKSVDVVVSELPEIFNWFGIKASGESELETWESNQDSLLEKIRDFCPIGILRSSNYTHEIVVLPDKVIGPTKLDYSSLPPRKKVGYGDFRTAQLIYNFLSPRIVLASKSPQRLELLRQLIAPGKIEVQVSNSDEDRIRKEDPFERVKRLAEAKARDIFNQGEFDDNIEFIIGADTEIVRQDEKDGSWIMVGHPRSSDQAEKDLMVLNGKEHIAITGIAIIGKNPKTGGLMIKTDCVQTIVTFAQNSEEKIESYAVSTEPIGRAGAYAIQGLGALLIKEIKGSYSNIVGLPLERLSEIFAQDFQRPIWMFDKVSRWNFSEPIKGLELP
jgi:septum formation protein